MATLKNKLTHRHINIRVYCRQERVNSTTTNLQQGLAKTWAFCTDDSITDSLNTSSSNDVDAGKYTITLTNNTATSNVAVSVTCNENLNLNGHKC